MTQFYLSPSSLSLRQYELILSAANSFGWTATWTWARESFRPEVTFKKDPLTKALRGISSADIFIAYIPGTGSTCIEIGMAYTLCEELFLVARNPVHFTQTGLADAYLSALPGIKRICCEISEIPAMLQKEYFHLINPV